MRPVCLLIILAGLLPAQVDQDQLIKDLEQSLMAPCCWSGTVYDHGHPEMEAEITALVEQGKTRQEIIDYYLDRYGERILAVPVARGFNLLAWIAPLIMALVAVTILVAFLRTPKTRPAVSPEKDDNIPFSNQIEKELKALD